MKIKENPQPVSTQDFFYDLFDGGYIDPEEQLTPEYANLVNAAIDTILEYRETLEENDLLEYN